MRTPILGGFYVAYSKNLADQRCVNLFPTTVDSKSGKDVGALYNTPGLDLLETVGQGPTRGSQPFGSNLIVVSGSGIYSVSPQFIATLLGVIPTSSAGPVSIINNGTQLVVFDGANGYLVPGGFPLTGGAVDSGGSQYAIGDTINLEASDGIQNATAQVMVTGISGDAVTAFSVTLTGVFNPVPTVLSQQSTSGSGSGFSMNSLTFGSLIGVYALTLPFSNPVSASYQDGLGVVSQLDSDKWWQSNVFDLSFWDPLNFSSADAAPDNIVSIAELHEEQFIFKQTNIEVWINAGLSGFAFQRLAGVHIETGCVAPFSPAKAGESLIWLGQNEEGNGSVYMVTGYEPRKVSTKAMDREIQSYSVISDAIGYAYEQSGHLFYVLIFPTANVTWAYDVSVGLWHQRAAFANNALSRHWSNCYSLFGNKRVVGDYRNGNLYAFNMKAQTDNGTAKKWLRSWRALEKAVFQPTTYSALQIDMQTGIDVPDGTSPQVMLRWSDDEGHNWSNQRFWSAGKTGETAQRVIFRRLGSTRLKTGLDRIFELSSTDAYPGAIIGADLT